jgi:hypothetical protein
MKESAEFTGKKMLETLAEVKDLLRNHSIAMDRLSDVTHVIPYNRGPVLEGYVEAEIQDGSALSWLLEATWDDEGWQIEASVVRTTRDTQETLQELPPENIPSFDQFTVRLVAVVKELLAIRIAILDS